MNVVVSRGCEPSRASVGHGEPLRASVGHDSVTLSRRASRTTTVQDEVIVRHELFILQSVLQRNMMPRARNGGHRPDASA